MGRPTHCLHGTRLGADCPLCSPDCEHHDSANIVSDAWGLDRCLACGRLLSSDDLMKLVVFWEKNSEHWYERRAAKYQHHDIDTGDSNE